MLPLFVAARRAALLCLPSAIIVAGIALPPVVSAQAPGGGPSSGPSATGWVAQPRTGVINPQSHGDYDQTGISGTVTRTPFTGSPQTETYQNYGGSRGYSYNGSNPMEYPFNSTGGNGNTLSKVSTSFSGMTTYKWKWVPPNNAAG